jgi:hypothetical protein
MARSEAKPMQAIFTTCDPVQLNVAHTLLAEANIEAIVLDASSSVIETLSGRPAYRLMVLVDDDVDEAKRILREGLSDG